MVGNCWIVGSLGCIFVLIVENLRMRNKSCVKCMKILFTFWHHLIKLLIPLVIRLHLTSQTRWKLRGAYQRIASTNGNSPIWKKTFNLQQCRFNAPYLPLCSAPWGQTWRLRVVCHRSTKRLSDFLFSTDNLRICSKS